MATKAELLLLGLLMDKPRHGYEINQLIQAEGIDSWLNVSMPAIYYSLSKLRDKGLVAETRQRGEGSPAKSTYHLTAAGREAFFTALEDSLASQERVYFDYDLPIYFINKLPLDRVLALLEQRRAFLDRWLAALDDRVAVEQKGEQNPLKLAILDHAQDYVRMEGDWLQTFAQRVEGCTQTRATAGDAHAGLMVLTGDLRNLHLPDLLRLVAVGKHSGTLTFTDGQKHRNITFQHGRPTCAWSERMTLELVPDSPPPQTLVLEDIYDVFRWQEGEFSLDQMMMEQAGCVPLDISVENLILGGTRWVDNWDAIQKFVPSSNAVFELSSRPETWAGLQLADDERRVLAAVNGLDDVAALARDNGLTVFEASRILYSLSALGLVRCGAEDKIRLRRLFRETAELMCRSTIAWRTSPTDRTCEEEVNQLCANLPLALRDGRIQDQTDPHLEIEELVEVYRTFVLTQLDVVSRRFGREKAQQSYERMLRQLAPELQETAARYGFDRLHK